MCFEGSLLSDAHSSSLCLPQGEGEVEMGQETQEDESGLLTIHDVTRAHAGLYQCTANNGIAPPDTVDVRLVVQCESVAFIYCQKGTNTHRDLLVRARTCFCTCQQIHVVSGFCMNYLHAHLVLCSQTRASERSPVEEGGE